MSDVGYRSVRVRTPPGSLSDTGVLHRFVTNRWVTGNVSTRSTTGRVRVEWYRNSQKTTPESHRSLLVFDDCLEDGTSVLFTYSQRRTPVLNWMEYRESSWVTFIVFRERDLLTYLRWTPFLWDQTPTVSLEVLRTCSVCDVTQSTLTTCVTLRRWKGGWVPSPSILLQRTFSYARCDRIEIET